MNLLRLLNKGLAKIESLLLAFALIFMIGLAFLQVVLRNGWDTGISWGDPIIRALVLWIGFLGASLATYQKGHLRFDVVAKFLPPKVYKVAESLVHFASAFVCVLLANAAYKFVRDEKIAETLLADIIPYWMVASMIPIAFLVMASRMVFIGLEDIINLIKAPEEEA